MEEALCDNEIFPLGSSVACTTAHDQCIHGEVFAFDRHHNLLALKTTTAGTTKGELVFVNINMVQNIRQTKPPPEDFRASLPPYDEAKIRERHQMSKAEKKRSMLPCDDITVEGEEMFKYLSGKYERKDVQWCEATIVVMGYVAVRAPYSPDDVRLRHNLEADPAHYIECMNFVKSLISKRASNSKQGSEAPTAVEAVENSS